MAPVTDSVELGEARLAELAVRIDRVRSQVADAALRSGRAPDEVSVVGVCKAVERPLVDAAYAVGLRQFGENRVQEAVAKFATPLPRDASLHLIGHLQSNKAKPAARQFSLVESVDRPSLVEALARAAAAVPRRLPVLIQVNLAGETQKAGCARDEARLLATQVRDAGNLDLLGLMTIAPLVGDSEETRPVFRALRELRDDLAERNGDLHLSVLSMGMSNDFAVAIEEGATQVRIGRAIFGERG